VVLEALSFESRALTLGQPWVLRVLVHEDTGTPPTAVITPPAGAAPTPPVFEPTSCPGVYRAEYLPDAPGRYLAQVTTGTESVWFVAIVSAVTSNADLPDVDAVNAYLGDHSFTDGEVDDMLRQETQAQRGRCRIPAAYPDDLRGALLRRVQRALHMKSLVLAVKETQDGESQIVVPGNDPEVRRLEAPWRRVLIG
jgi:hypothetical protein